MKTQKDYSEIDEFFIDTAWDDWPTQQQMRQIDIETKKLLKQEIKKAALQTPNPLKSKRAIKKLEAQIQHQLIEAFKNKQRKNL